MSIWSITEWLIQEQMFSVYKQTRVVGVVGVSTKPQASTIISKNRSTSDYHSESVRGELLKCRANDSSASPNVVVT